MTIKLDRRAALGLACLGLGLGACAPVDHGFGETLAYAKAAQTVNPDPVYADGGAQPGDNADVGAAAAERYRTGTVTEVEAVRSTEVSGGGG
ncbi:hypothetical protein [Sphingomicrobium arenosum]|uniref:hypothetical protein n=1 Tax=Sphingomicrobium arenosum TaxID=2233861 RepID=UPI0022410243|nr:hypothetical protein [Sphingomicrobium arenosum]